MLRTSVHVAQSPDIRCGGAQQLVHFHRAAFGELHAGCFEIQAFDVWRAAGGHQNGIRSQAELSLGRVGG